MQGISRGRKGICAIVAVPSPLPLIEQKFDFVQLRISNDREVCALLFSSFAHDAQDMVVSVGKDVSLELAPMEAATYKRSMGRTKKQQKNDCTK